MIDLLELSSSDLLKLRTAVDHEVRRRGLASTVGDLGEELVIRLFKDRPDLPVLVAAPRGTKNVDALSRDGERYSVKTLLRAKKTGTVYPDLAEPDRQLFEFLVVAVLSEEFELSRVVLLSWAQFVKARSWDSRMNAWYVAKSARAMNIGRQLFP